MINAATAKKLNSSIASNMGLIGSTIQMARSNEPDEKAVVERIQVEQGAITSLLVSIVDYLGRLDQSLKIQTKIARFVYNQQAISQREQAIEQTSTRVEPDAVPVAANDNEEEKTGSALGALASGFVITATGLLVANYKSVMDKLKSAANMLGLGADVATQQQIEDQTPQSQDLQSAAPRTVAPQAAAPRTVAPQASTSQAPPPPAVQRPKSNPISTSMGGSSPSASTNSSRVAASTPFSSTPTAVPPLLARPTATPTQKPESESVGEIPTDIVQLGKYLQKEGYRISGHSQFGGREYGDHSTNSKHYTDNALDVNVGTGIHEASHPVHGPKLDQLAAKLKKAGYSVIWRAAGHHNHLHVQRGGASNVGSGDNEGMFGSEGPIAQSLDSVREGLSRGFEHLKPTNIMTRKIGDEALNREMDLMAKPPSTGRQQGHFGKPEAAKIPSPTQQSAAKTGVDVTSQYMFMFFGERPQAASVSNLTQSK